MSTTKETIASTSREDVSMEQQSEPAPPSSPEGPKRVTVNFAPSTYRVLRELASDRGKTIAEVLREAIALSKWVYDTRKQGGHILVEYNGKTHEIVPL